MKQRKFDLGKLLKIVLILIIGLVIIQIAYPFLNKKTVYSEKLEQNVILPRDWSIGDGEENDMFFSIGSIRWRNRDNSRINIKRMPPCTQDCPTLEELMEQALKELVEQFGPDYPYVVEPATDLKEQKHANCDVVSWDLTNRSTNFPATALNESIYAMDCDGEKYVMNTRTFDENIEKVKRIGIRSISDFE